MGCYLVEISDIITFQKQLKYDIDEQESVVAYISVTLDKTNLQYSFNIQIFNKDFYNANQDIIEDDIISFYEEIGDYLAPSKQARLFNMMAYR